jgi:hypothetical protein
MVFKYGHGGIHLAEAKLFVEWLLARIGIKDDFFMSPGEFNQFSDYGLSQPQPLETWMNSYVAQVRTVGSISQSPPHRNNFIIMESKTFEFAVAKYNFQIFWVLFTKRSDFIQL